MISRRIHCNDIAEHGFVQNVVIVPGDDVCIHAVYAARFCANYIVVWGGREPFQQGARPASMLRKGVFI